MIELKAHETAQFDVQYIATTAKRREALLVFMNETIGEFLFLIEGVPKKPEYVQSRLLTIVVLMSHFLDRFLSQVRKQWRSIWRKVT